MLKIVVYSDSPVAPTGFGRVIANIFAPLIEQRFLSPDDVAFYGINYDGAHHGTAFRIWPACSGMSPDRDPYGRNRFCAMMFGGAWPCDILFILLDHFSLVTPVVIDGQMVPFISGLIRGLRQQQQQGRPPIRVVQYLPIDSDTLHPDWVTWMPELIDAPVVYTEFGRRVLLDMVPSLSDKLRVIPHGTNPETFFPLPAAEREVFRQQALGLKAGQPLIVNVNRNQPRKDLPRTLQAFKFVLDQIPEAVLYCHCNVVDSAGFNLQAIAHALRIPQQAVRFPAAFSEGIGVPLPELNKVYNAADVVVTTARGEGWGLCCHPETMVFTKRGWREISTVQVSDEVLSRLEVEKGAVWCAVKAISQRSYSGELISIATRTGPLNDPLRVTPDHLVATSRGWVKAGELTEDDEIAFGFWTMPSQRVGWPRIDLADYVPNDWCRTEKHIWQYGKRQRTLTDRFVFLTKECAELFGYYLAEGSPSAGGIVFSVGKHENDLTNRIVALVKSVLGKNAAVENAKASAKRWIRVYSVAWKHIMPRLLGRGSQHKTLDVIRPLLNRHASAKVLWGFFRGDGHYEKDRGIVDMTTVSKSLIYGLYELLQGLGYDPRIEWHNKSRNAYRIRLRPDDTVRFLVNNTKRGGRRKKWCRADQVFLEIKKLGRELYEGLVHDLSVDGEPEFLTVHGVVHNSVSESMTAAACVVAPDHTSLHEILSNDRGMLVPPAPLRESMIADNDQFRPVADAPKMAEALIWALRNPNQARAIGARAREWALRMTWRTHIVPQWREIFEGRATAPMARAPSPASLLTQRQPIPIGAGLVQTSGVAQRYRMAA